MSLQKGCFRAGSTRAQYRTASSFYIIQSLPHLGSKRAQHRTFEKKSMEIDRDEIEEEYFIFRSRECGFADLFRSFLSPDAPLPGAHMHVNTSSMMQQDSGSSWQAKLAILILKLLHLVSKALASVGEVIEICMNTVHVNGGLFNMIQKILSGRGIIIPDEDSADYWSIIGFLDPRTDLLHGEYHEGAAASSKIMADTCMMASKLAYENVKIINRIITHVWKMQFVNVYECLNKYQPSNSTQVLIFMDRPADAQAIFVTFRGTMPFNAYDWSTDFDFSWYQLPGIGRVHVGFLEALSLVDRHDMDSFSRFRINKRSGLSMSSQQGDDHQTKKPALAYDTARDELKQLLKTHKNAKVYVTGHSLGGALATVFTTILFYNQENSITEKLSALYTFGQPRVGDKEFAATMTEKLNASTFQERRFLRLVYSNDLVPRIPFDDFVFQFKHIRPCFLYSSFYTDLTIMREEPNKNYFSPLYWISNHAIAVWELLQSFVLHYRYGESYRESASSLVLRIGGLVFPGIAAHSPVNYVNAVRLGPEMLIPPA